MVSAGRLNKGRIGGKGMRSSKIFPKGIAPKKKGRLTERPQGKKVQKRGGENFGLAPGKTISYRSV